MALKDWVRRKNNKNLIWFQNNKGMFPVVIEIFYDPEFDSIKKPWGLEIDEKGIDKSFKTKSQALKFAKSYMRTH